ncbi:putative ABC transport system substrate-binding protein [Candidatus Xenohaliotis californiensis]|uniref:ABC transport system substrate-binding protein n=1 Tax=Candidatus Xenohaliotis californiensis TaxID=84677 RepID=A0ABM9N765_9RICK|nr:putative ABC transport system substrate-binding protein [Candidatus Xenohaliotis californiensis]
MKKIIVILLLCIPALNGIMAAENMKKVYISQIIQHPALDVTVRGIIDGLRENGYIKNKNVDIRIESAQANAALASQIAAKFVNSKPDVVVGVGTVTAQSFLRYVYKNKAKLVFSSITDPVQAGFVDSLLETNYSVSGVSNFIELKPQLELFQKIQPNLKTLGVLYNPGESNSLSINKHLESICPKFGIKLILQSANKTADIPQAATKLANAVDAIFVGNDNTALAALQSIIAIANRVKIPVYVSDTDSVEAGALAALGPNQYQVGLQTGSIVAHILNGKETNAIPIKFVNKTELYLNNNAAAILDIKFPDKILNQASKIIK